MSPRVPVSESGWENLAVHLCRPDNIAVGLALALLAFFTLLAWREARRNDRVVGDDRKQRILRRMQD